MPANENTNRAQGALLQSRLDADDGRGHGPLLPLQGHRALRKGRVSIANGVYLVTATPLERQQLFTDFGAGCAAALCFEDARLLGDAKMLAWVLMPDHVHWLLQMGGRDELSAVVSRLKSASARHANRALSRTGAVWAKAFHDHALRDEDGFAGYGAVCGRQSVACEIGDTVGGLSVLECGVVVSGQSHAGRAPTNPIACAPNGYDRYKLLVNDWQLYDNSSALPKKPGSSPNKLVRRFVVHQPDKPIAATDKHK